MDSIAVEMQFTVTLGFQALPPICATSYSLLFTAAFGSSINSILKVTRLHLLYFSPKHETDKEQIMQATDTQVLLRAEISRAIAWYRLSVNPFLLIIGSPSPFHTYSPLLGLL